jgi:hypothetical protein
MVAGKAHVGSAAPVGGTARPGWRTDAVLSQAWGLLYEARTHTLAADRFRIAHLAALRATAALLGARGDLNGRRRPTSAWILLARSMPELADWASYFAAGARRRAAADAGAVRAVDESSAAELVDAVQTYLVTVGMTLLSGRADGTGVGLPDLIRVPAAPGVARPTAVAS